MAARFLPRSLKPLAKTLYFRGSNPVHSKLKKFGTVQDLYYWVADAKLDTMLLLQNYFSALYPELETETDGRISLYGDDGEFLGSNPFSLAHNGAARFRVSSLLNDLQDSPSYSFGTLEVHIDIPRAVLDHIQDQRSLYFWDRFYISYVSSQGQPCFVHGVDKTNIYRDGTSEPIAWYPEPLDHQWAPEMPLNLEEYERFSVIMINRTLKETHTTLTLWDREDKNLSWSVTIPPRGIHRFVLSKDDVPGLIATDLRMGLTGMATKYGRPAVFKEFANGAVSAMHC